MSQAFPILQGVHLIKTPKPSDKKPEHLVQKQFLRDGFLRPGGPSPRSWDATEGMWSHQVPL